jgi:hydroxymethylpyrimidine/phosphomethylpyrimidine kinase
MSVITLVTVQNTRQVERVELLPTELISAQWRAVVEDIPPRAVKTGALGSSEIARTVAEHLQQFDGHVVVDPVLVSKHGHSLVTDDVVQAYREFVLPQAFILTPNRFEAERLSGLSLSDEDSLRTAVQRLVEFGAKHVLVKLGEVDGQSQHALYSNQELHFIGTPRLNFNNTHGSGCVLSAALTASLALGVTDVVRGVRLAIDRTYESIAANSQLGHGIHPVETRGMTRDDLA